MATREQIETQIAAIDARLNSGVERVAYQDGSASFNLSELRRRRSELTAELAALDGRSRVRHIRTYSTKGY